MEELDPRFPGGVWTGFYLQYWLPGRHRTDAVLAWSAGEVSGGGADHVGTYTMSGSYDVATGSCEWTKQYLGKHAVQYRGLADASGVWGVWEIRLLGGLYHDRGGFHLWPEGRGVSEAELARTEAAVQELMHAEFGGRTARAVRAVFAVGVVVALAALAAWWAGY